MSIFAPARRVKCYNIISVERTAAASKDRVPYIRTQYQNSYKPRGLVLSGIRRQYARFLLLKKKKKNTYIRILIYIYIRTHCTHNLGIKLIFLVVVVGMGII